MKREYFYTDSQGKIRPYHYCSECGKLYNDDEFKAGLIISMGLENAPTKYCATPCFGIKFPAPPKQIFVPIVDENNPRKILREKA